MVAEVLLPLPETEIDARAYDDQRGEVVCPNLSIARSLTLLVLPSLRVALAVYLAKLISRLRFLTREK
jgi:hypothetical protein